MSLYIEREGPSERNITVGFWFFTMTFQIEQVHKRIQF